MLTHTSPAPQGWSHPPQCAGSIEVSGQEAPHGWTISPQVAVHAPPLHICPAAHACAHPPQFAPSVCRSTQALPQRVVPGGQVQAPAWQTSPPGQAWPQPPQWRASRVTSTHPSLAQVVLLVGQAHVPAAQTCPVPQLSHDAPQCRGSTAVSQQRPSPHASAALCVQVATQLPSSQCWPAEQVVVQSPQWLGSKRVSVHAPSHAVRPWPHVQAPSRQKASVSWQGMKQAPQLSALWRVSRQTAPEQSSPRPPQLHSPAMQVVPGGQNAHVVGVAQRPASQDWPDAQARLQPPQCCALLCTSTQSPPHATSGASQEAPGPSRQVRVLGSHDMRPGQRPSKSHGKTSVAPPHASKLVARNRSARVRLIRSPLPRPRPTAVMAAQVCALAVPGTSPVACRLATREKRRRMASGTAAPAW